MINIARENWKWCCRKCIRPKNCKREMIWITESITTCRKSLNYLSVIHIISLLHHMYINYRVVQEKFKLSFCDSYHFSFASQNIWFGVIVHFTWSASQLIRIWVMVLVLMPVPVLIVCSGTDEENITSTHIIKTYIIWLYYRLMACCLSHGPQPSQARPSRLAAHRAGW